MKKEFKITFYGSSRDLEFISSQYLLKVLSESSFQANESVDFTCKVEDLSEVDEDNDPFFLFPAFAKNKNEVL